MVAPVRRTSGQKRLTENRRAIDALAADEQRAHDAHRDRVEVEQRQRREDHVVGPATPGPRDLLAERDHVPVREHATLRRSGRARRVDEAREVRRVERDGRQGLDLGVGRGDDLLPARPRHDAVERGPVADDHGPGERERLPSVELGDPGREVLLHHDDGRAAVREHVPEELALVRRVDRHLDRAQAHRREERHDLLGTVLEQRGHAVPSPDAERGEPRRHPPGALGHLACGQPDALEVEVGTVGVGGEPALQGGPDRGRQRHRVGA